MPEPLAPTWVRAAGLVARAMPAARYRFIARLRRRPPAPFWRRLPRESGGYSFRCDLRDAIAAEVCFTGRYEPQETALMRSILRPGMVFADVGANWGYFTLLGAALVGDGGRIVSLEPDPRLFVTLHANVVFNGLRHVTAVQTAAGATAGVVTLAGYDEDTDKWGLSRLVDRPPVGVETFEVNAASVDAVLDEQGVRGVDLLKMDIEGAEELALQGMADGLKRHRYRRVLLELHPTLLAERGRTLAPVISLLVDQGYRGWWIDHSPATNRRAAYARAPRPERWLRPVEVSSPGGWPDDAWPHTLWLSPEVGSWQSA